MCSQQRRWTLPTVLFPEMFAVKMVYFKFLCGLYLSNSIYWKMVFLTQYINTFLTGVFIAHYRNAPLYCYWPSYSHEKKQRLFRVDGISTDNHNFQISWNFGAPPLREKCSNTEFFLVRIFPHSDWIRRDISPYSVQMRENTDQKKLHIWSVFTQCTYLAHKI